MGHFSFGKTSCSTARRAGPFWPTGGTDQGESGRLAERAESAVTAATVVRTGLTEGLEWAPCCERRGPVRTITCKLRLPPFEPP